MSETNLFVDDGKNVFLFCFVDQFRQMSSGFLTSEAGLQPVAPEPDLAQVRAALPAILFVGKITRIGFRLPTLGTPVVTTVVFSHRVIWEKKFLDLIRFAKNIKRSQRTN